jgi:hypothetical protein
MALQSSNIFNQNNTSQNLPAFYDKVKEIQMNPKTVEDENSSHSSAAAANEMTTLSWRRQY